MFLNLLQQIKKGVSLSRALQNCFFEGVELRGNVLDLGAKSTESSYYKYFEQSQVEKISFVDLYPKNKEVIQLDLEDKFPIDDSQYDAVLVCNILEHLYSYQNTISEGFRVLKDEGVLIGSVPFLYKVHPDPDVFFRFTKSSLQKIFENAGLKNVKISPLSIGPFTAGISGNSE